VKERGGTIYSRDATERKPKGERTLRLGSKGRSKKSGGELPVNSVKKCKVKKDQKIMVA